MLLERCARVRELALHAGEDGELLLEARAARASLVPLVQESRGLAPGALQLLAPGIERGRESPALLAEPCNSTRGLRALRAQGAQLFLGRVSRTSLALALLEGERTLRQRLVLRSPGLLAIDAQRVEVRLEPLHALLREGARLLRVLELRVCGGDPAVERREAVREGAH